MESEIYTILVDLGYNLKQDIKGWRSSSIYRQGDNPTSLLIYKDGSGFTDFVEGKTGTFDELIQLSLGLKTPEQAKEWLKNKNINLELTDKTFKAKVQDCEYLDADELKKVIKNNSYWNNRGISDETLEQFPHCGVLESGKMKDRYVFPVFDAKDRLIGLNGRTLKNSSIKWKILGQKTKFVYPLENESIKKENKVILVESMGCVLSLYECGIKNVKCVFGIEMNLAILNLILRLNPSKIVVSLNNEDSCRGNEASDKLYRRLLKYFNEGQVKVNLPKCKDFNEWLQKPNGRNEIIEWYKNI
jgi:hypothetical protein